MPKSFKNVVNTPPPEGGGFELRLKAGSVRPEEDIAWARKALAQNPRFANAARVLAVNLAHLGQIEAAREAAAESLRIDPDFTISKFRSRRRFIGENLWQTFSAGMRLAGLPE